jgi:hypothetical protein
MKEASSEMTLAKTAEQASRAAPSSAHSMILIDARSTPAYASRHVPAATEAKPEPPR